MKKFIKNNIFGFILGLLVAGTVGVFAYSYVASQISYTTDKNENIKNVEEALNDLSEKQEEITKPITIKNITVESYSTSYSSYISFKLGQFINLYKYFSVTSASCNSSCVSEPNYYQLFDSGWQNTVVPELNQKYSLSDYQGFWATARTKTNNSQCYCKFDVTLSN